MGGAIAEGRGWAYTDYRIREDGFTRFLLLNRALGVGQAGRMVQRLLEIETYRMMALAAFPVAREATPELAALESELGRIVEGIAKTGKPFRQVIEEICAVVDGPVSAEATSMTDSW